MTLSSMRMAVFTVRSMRPWSNVPSTMWLARLTEPRLHTATSVSEVLSVISVHRFDECTTPTCCCGERRLHGSLNVTHGWPVSNNIDSILRHRSLAGMRLKFLMRPSSARRSYSVRSEEHTSELQSLMRISYDVF